MRNPKEIPEHIPESERVAQILSGRAFVYSVEKDKFGNKTIIWKCPQDDQFLRYVTDQKKLPESVRCLTCNRVYSLCDPERKFK